MVPDRDQRAIERKIFPAEVGFLITYHYRLTICPEAKRDAF
jgi:hypothetical protein